MRDLRLAVRPFYPAQMGGREAFGGHAGADMIALTVIPDDAHVGHVGKPEAAGQNGHVQRVAAGEELAPVKVEVDDIVADAEKSVRHAGSVLEGAGLARPLTFRQ